MIRQFGLYPRFFVKKRSLLDPLITKYTNEPLTDKPKGQVMKIYFNLLRTNTAFRAEVDELIKQAGSKLLTVQERLAGKRISKDEKAATKNKNEVVVEPQTNFVNADGDIPVTELNQGTEAEFLAAIQYEEKQETTSNALKIGGIILIGIAAWYAYKKFIK